ncbi:ribosome maturation factor RimM [Ruania suaedae]|uniref:ribosome maturation factor RimM n=1 Tax=Ruania suaedae TaxID=2897774 RepID=UPI001E485ED2|nr:ribosome maturation factor RimM [Ruania suaedae]UFU04149.1 ribosome maturation factor RimM [Ruania suaedae]
MADPVSTGNDSGTDAGTDPGPRLLRVATVGAPHGLRGEVRVIARTDDPDSRLGMGSELITDPVHHGPVRVAAFRRQQQHLHLRFEGIDDRTAAEGLRGVELYAEPGGVEDEAWYPFQLQGLRAVRPDGSELGVIAGIEHSPAHDLLVLAEPRGARTLVPFVAQIVPEVDVAGGRIVIDPPPGLLAGEEER